MRLLLHLLVAVLLLPRSALAVFPQGSTGLALPCAEGVTIDGARLGDADYDPSHPDGGRLRLGDSPLSLAALCQSTDLDDKGSSFSAITLSLEHVVGPDLVRLVPVPVVSPYLAVGVSYMTMAVEVLGPEADDTALMLQFGAGAGVRLTDALALDVRYRYLELLERTMWLHGKPARIDVSRHNLLVGMRFGF